MGYVEIPLKNILYVKKIATILYFGFSPGYRSGLDVHNFWELIYVDKGITRINAGNREFPLKCGEMILHAPNLPHRISCDEPHSANVFIISFNCKSPAMKLFGASPIAVPPSIRSLITALIDEGTKNFDCSSLPLKPVRNAPIGGQQMIRILLETLLIQLLRIVTASAPAEAMPLSAPTPNNLADCVKLYLDNHIYEKVTIEQLCEIFHYGKSRLCAVFRAATGRTIITYHTEKKIEEAKELMRQGKTIRETAAILGFETPQYFSRVFKTYTGMPPHDYRDSLLFSVNAKVKRRQLNAGSKKITEI
jgi:AraC-like DNA-binding protein